MNCREEGALKARRSTAVYESKLHTPKSATSDPTEPCLSAETSESKRRRTLTYSRYLSSFREQTELIRPKRKMEMVRGIPPPIMTLQTYYRPPLNSILCNKPCATQGGLSIRWPPSHLFFGSEPLDSTVNFHGCGAQVLVKLKPEFLLRLWIPRRDGLSFNRGAVVRSRSR